MEEIAINSKKLFMVCDHIHKLLVHDIDTKIDGKVYEDYKNFMLISDIEDLANIFLTTYNTVKGSLYTNKSWIEKCSLIYLNKSYGFLSEYYRLAVYLNDKAEQEIVNYKYANEENIFLPELLLYNILKIFLLVAPNEDIPTINNYLYDIRVELPQENSDKSNLSMLNIFKCIVNFNTDDIESKISNTINNNKGYMKKLISSIQGAKTMLDIQNGYIETLYYINELEGDRVDRIVTYNDVNILIKHYNVKNIFQSPITIKNSKLEEFIDRSIIFNKLDKVKTLNFLKSETDPTKIIFVQIFSQYKDLFVFTDDHDRYDVLPPFSLLLLVLCY